MTPPRRFAPPPTRWPGKSPPATVQPQATFGALRTAAAGRGGPGDELLPSRGEDFLLKTSGRGLHVKPDGTYNFVRVAGGKPNDARTVVSPRSNHASLADGRPVLYAGTLRFEAGHLDWWSNYSGTYQPAAAFRQQAGLPDERFVPWQKLQMGGVGLQRNMLGERRAATRPEAPEPGPAKPAAKVEAVRPEAPKVDAPTAGVGRAEVARPEAAKVVPGAGNAGAPSSGTQSSGSGRSSGR